MSTVRGREGVKECVAKCGIRWRGYVTVIHDKVNPSSGSQPGVRVPPGVREKSLEVRQIFFTS